MGSRWCYVIRECPHDGRHQHGTRIAYDQDLCRCDACSAAASEYRLAREKAIANGQPLTVPAMPIARHVRRLVAGGKPIKQIEREAGLSSGALQDLAAGKRTYVRRTTANAVLGVAPGPGTQIIPSAGTVRRCRGLVAVGWSMAAIAERAGVSDATLCRAQQVGRIRADLAAAVATAYEDMWDAAPPRRLAAHNRTRARADGWPPPAAYDDATIDDPSPRVDAAARRACGIDVRARRGAA